MLGFVFISVIFVFRGLRITASLRTGPNIILNFSTAPQGLAIIFWPSAKTFLQFVGEGAVRLRIVNSKLQLKHKQDCRSGVSFLTSQLLNFLCFIVIEMESERSSLVSLSYCDSETSFTFPTSAFPLMLRSSFIWELLHVYTAAPSWGQCSSDLEDPLNLLLQKWSVVQTWSSLSVSSFAPLISSSLPRTSCPSQSLTVRTRRLGWIEKSFDGSPSGRAWVKHFMIIHF